jgi:hypothetical protein
MLKKVILSTIIVISLLFSVTYTQAITNTSTPKSGISPDSPIYFIEKIEEKIKTMLTFGEIKKAERYIDLAEKRLEETKLMLENNNTKKAEEAIKKYEIYLTKMIKQIEKAREKDLDINNFLNETIKKTTQQEVRLNNLLEQTTEENKLIFEQALNTKKQREKELIDNLPEDERTKIINNIKKKRQETQQALLNTTNNLISDNSPTPISNQPEESGGKPNMNEEGATEVTKPNTSSNNTNTKLISCIVSCGENMIDNCNNVHSLNAMYDLNMCRGECTEYVLFYGCSMEMSCDTPCWSNYFEECDENVYSSCIDNCKNTFDN